MAFPTTVLPLPLDDMFVDEPSLQQAYESLCAYEARHSAPINDPLPARWLGHLLREVPLKGDLANEITSCEDDAAIRKLSIFYRDRFLRVFKAIGGPTPAPSDHPSRPSFDVMQELNAVLQDKNVPRDHGQAKRLALIRDDNRSISGHFERGVPNPPGYVTVTNAAHIIPFCLNSNQDNSTRRDWSGGVLTVLERVGGIVPDDLHGDLINRLSNIITMNAEHHGCFDQLDWWMEPASSGDPHHYVVRYIQPILNLPSEVRFTSSNPLLELPDPRFIAIHAACCRVAHLSGAAEYIEDIYRKTEMTYVLADNGSSAELLQFALSKLQLVYSPA